jgi:hypothetical protein
LPSQFAPNILVLKTWVAKNRGQKQGHCYSKREEAAYDCVFFHPTFCNPYLGAIFKFSDPKNISGQPDKLEWWVQIDWASL